LQLLHAIKLLTRR